jgi:hypothetical protein
VTGGSNHGSAYYCVGKLGMGLTFRSARMEGSAVVMCNRYQEELS